MKMRVLITRPGEDGEALAKLLQVHGIETAIEPLLNINHFDGPLLSFDNIQAILVTSANGVRALARRTSRRDIPIYAVGDATASTAKEAEFFQIHSADGNLDDLIELVKDMLIPKDGALLHIAGSSVAGNLIGSIRNIGFKCTREVLYEAIAERSLTLSTVAAIKSEDINTVILYSPRSAKVFAELIRKGRLVRNCNKMIAVCLSQAVADQIKSLTWQRIYIAAKPNQGSLITLLTDLVNGAKDQDSQADSQPVEPATKNIGEHTIKIRKKHAGSTFKTVFITLLCATVLVGLSVASKPLWYSQLKGFAPSYFEPSKTDAKLTNLNVRLNAIEENQEVPDLRALLGEKERQKARLDMTLKRLDELEKSFYLLKKFNAAISKSSIKGANQTLQNLSDRLLKLENRTSKTNIGNNLNLSSRSSNIPAKSNPNIANSSQRITAGKLIFLIGQLREAINKGGSYNKELAAIISIVEKNPRLRASMDNNLNQLATFSRSGVPNFAMLKSQFNEQAEKIVHAALIPIKGTWVQRTFARLLESVKWRRIDNHLGNGIEAIVARAERALKSQNIGIAIKELSTLTGPPAIIAKKWVIDAANYLLTERVLTRLQANAVAQMLPGK